MAVNATIKATFPGGTHPPENKGLTEKCEIQARLRHPAKQISVPLSQHIGAACEPVVKKGDELQTGQKVGDSEAFVSAPVHSSVNGKVKQIAMVSHPVLGRTPAVIITVDPENNPVKEPASGKFSEDFDASKYSSGEICEAVREAGIVGMGGAGFPTRVKVCPNPQMPIKTMIINGSECEPFITCDYRIMLDWTWQVIAGVKLARRASGCSRTLIAIEDNKPQAIEVMSEALEKAGQTDQIEVVELRTKYPQGGERQLIQSVLNKTVPTGGIPPMIGVLVLNVATVSAIAEAVVFEQPLTHRVVTVTGKGVPNPGNFYVPIGMPIEELIESCGGLSEDAVKVIVGGPMMGISIGDLSTPVTKTTNAVTVLTKREIGGARLMGRQSPCIRCGRCLEVCPENLNPTKIAHAVKYNDLELADSYYMSACIECGCCSYVCPAKIELTGYIKTGKILKARQKKKMG